MKRRRTLMEAVEPRLLFSADPAAALVEAFGPPGPETALHLDLPAAETSRRELVVIDGGVAGYEALVADLRGRETGNLELEILVLDPDRDGVAQVSEALARQEAPLDAVHLVSHGSTSELWLGNSRLAAEGLGSFESQIAGWKGALAEDADLLVYCCNLAAGEDGRALLARLGELTGADLAASDDVTGLGGDWQLEYRAGSLETGVAFSAEARAGWGGRLAAAPVGPPIRVNGAGGGNQFLGTGFEHPQSVAMAPDGSFAVTWTSTSGGQDVYVRLFNADGSPKTGDIPVNDVAAFTQNQPSIAMDDSGDFVVVFAGDGPGDTDGIFARRFNADGTPKALEFRVNSTIGGWQVEPAVAMDADGDFVVSWWGPGIGDGNGVFFQRYNSSGVAQGGETRANIPWTSGSQVQPDIAMDPSGNFVIAWEGQGPGEGFGIWAQRFSNLGAPQGGMIQVNTTTPFAQYAPSVEMNATGEFVVAWSGNGPSDSNGVFFQRFDATGSPLGIEENVTSNNDIQERPALAMDAAGNFVVAWADDGGNWDIYARAYLSDGTAEGGRFVVNTGYTANNQTSAGIAMNALGDYVVVWDGDGATDFTGIYAQRFTHLNAAPVLDPGGLMRFTQVAANDANPPGDSVAALIAGAGGDRITDTDGLAVEGIAVIAVDDSHGTWQYHIGGGWLDLGPVSTAAARLLDPAARIRFVPDPDYFGPGGRIQFHAWDQTTGTNGLTADVSTTGDATAFSDETEIAGVYVELAPQLWLTTDGDVSAGSQPGFDTWDKGDLVGVADPNLAFERDTPAQDTDGTFSVAFDIEAFANDAKTNGVHRVGQDIKVGASNFQLRAGDLLLTLSGGQTLKSESTPTAPGFTNVLTVSDKDVFVFRPDTPGDYGAGTFAMLLDEPIPGKHVRGLTLVESDTVVGDVTLSAGDFLLTSDLGGNQIHRFETSDVGPALATSGTTSVLLDGDDLGVAIEDKFVGIDLVERGFTTGGRTLVSGTILLTIDDADVVGDNALPVERFDVFALEVAKTTPGAGIGNGEASASLFFDGSDVGFGHDTERLDGFTLVAIPNAAPVLNPSGPDFTDITEDETLNGGDTVASLLGSSVTDSNVGAVEGIAVTAVTNGGGAWQFSTDNGGSWLPVGSVSDSSALLLRDIDLLRFVPDGENGESPNPTVSYRAWDQTEGTSGNRFDASSPGGTSAFSLDKDTADILVSSVNDAPTLGDGTLAAVNEDTTNPPGATITSLFGSGFGDVDAGASFSGIAVVGNAAPGTEGVWQYSSDGGSNWFAVGSVDDTGSALAIQATSLVRFLPAADYNGTPTDLVLRGLDNSHSGPWSTTGAGETRATIDTSSPGGTTPVAAATSDLSTSINSMNDAPTLGDAVLAAVDEDTTNPPGATVDALFGATFADPDSGSSFSGIAVVGNAAPAAEGVWQYSSDGGSTWSPVGVVGDGPAALALEADSGLRFVPAANYNGSPTDLVVRALDDAYSGAWSSSGGAGVRISIDTTLTGGTKPISGATSTLSTTINPVNDAPTLGDATLAAVDEDTTSPSGATITSLLDSGFGDIDPGASFAGIAVVGNAAPGAEGVWQYSSDSGTTWFAVGTVDDTGSGLAIQATSHLRFVPAADYNGTPTDLILRGLDNSYSGSWSTTGGGETRVTVDTTSPGGTTPITAATSNLDTSVNAVNDAPTLGDGTLAAVAEDTTSPPGASIDTLFGGSFADIDASASFAGIAVVGNTAPGTEGVWQYSSDGGSNWFAIGSVNDTGSALAIQATSLLRFLPAADYNGTPTDLVLRGLDDTYSGGWSTTAPGETRVTLDTSSPGGTTPITAATSALDTSITPVNDAPTLGNAVLAAVDEDATNPPGATIASLFGAGFGDIDAGASFAGIAVVGNAAPGTEGVWQYSSDGGSTWFAVGSVTDGSTALAIQATSQLRFLPTADYNGSPTDLVLRGLDNSYAGAWSTTGGGETRVSVDTTSRGGITPITAATSNLDTSINAVNDAPTLGDGTLAAVNEDATNPPGATIISLFGSGFGDIDASASFAGIAVVGNAAPGTEGVWQYSSDGGTTWFSVGAVADGPTALAIQATSQLRFLPAANYNGTPTDLSLRGLDNSYAGAWSTTGGGETRVTVNTTSPGGTTPIAAATSNLDTSVNAVNDAPTLGNGTLAAVNEDAGNPPGATIASLFGAGFGDIDAGASFAGIAVVGNTAPGTEGVWQYSSDGGTNWFAVGTVDDTGSALAIRATSLLRFLPAADYNGTPTDLVLRGLDNSYSGSWSDTSAGETRIAIDTSSPGGSSPIAAATSALDTSITPVNDAPTLGNGTLAAVNEDASNPPGATIASLFGATFGDIDAGASFAGIAVVGNAAPGTEGVWQYSSDGGTTWFAVGSVADGPTALAIQATSQLRFLPATDYNGSPTDLALRGLDNSYSGAWSTTGGGETRVTVDTASPGGTTPITAATSNLDTSVNAVNDAPTLGDDTLPPVAEDTTNPPGDTISNLFGASFADIDAGSSFSGIAVVGNTALPAAGVWQYSSDGGTTWFAVGSVADGPTALAIQATSTLRFLPAAAYTGTPSGLLLRGLDDSYAGSWSTTGGGETRVTLDTSSPGGTTPIAAATSTLSTSITPANDAPTLGNGILAAVDEDNANPPGDTVDSLFGATFADIDASSSFFGIAVVGNAAPGTEGVWQYSSDGGANWFAVGSVADGPTALAIQATSQLRFLPATNYNGTPTDLSLRGMDDSYSGGWSTTTGGSETRVTIDTSGPGGSSAIAAATSTLATSINALNDAPVLDDSGSFALANINEDAVPTGDSVASILASAGAPDRLTDVDALPVEGIAVTGVDDSDGTWQYKIGAGAWTGFGGVSASNAVVLRDTDLVRFLPNADYEGSAGILTFRGWDRSDGVFPGSTVNPGAGGGTDAYSIKQATATLTVLPVNDAPVLDGTSLFKATAVAANDPNPPGNSVAGLLASAAPPDRLTDVDASPSEGIAILSVDDSNGTWQFKVGAGAWTNVGSVGISNTLLLRDTDLLRFVPNPGYSGPGGNVEFRGWDRTDAALAGTKVNPGIPGGSSAYSAASGTLALSITPAPVVPPIIPGPGPGPIVPPGPGPVIPGPTPITPSLSAPGRGELPKVSAPPPPSFEAATPPERARLGLVVTEETRSEVDDTRPLRDELERRFLDSQTALAGELDHLRDRAGHELRLGDMLTVSSLGLATTLSIGYVVWLTQGGLLMASLMSSMPAWKLIDPLPVLAGRRRGGDGDDESLGSMLEASEASAEPPQAPEPPEADPGQGPEKGPTTLPN